MSAATARTFLPLLEGEHRENAFSGRLRAFRSDVEHAGVVENGDVVLASREALLVDADVLDGRGFTPLEAAYHRPIHNRLHGIPEEAEQRCRRRQACRISTAKASKSRVNRECLPGPRRH